MFKKRQGNIMSSLMKNWDIAEETLGTSQNSEGSAERELNSYQEGLQYSLDRLKATWQEFSNTAMNSDFLKAAVDSAQSLLDAFTKLAGLGNGAGLAGILGLGAGSIAMFKNLD